MNAISGFGIEPCDRAVEERRERHPREIGHEERAGGEIDRPERNERCRDREPEADDHGESTAHVPLTEEDDRPCDVERELQREEPERDRDGGSRMRM